ncbi:IS110 family transposase [Saccharothrix sp. NRRL B-16348]|uniref:IS110 family transposase n=1 Tax=Saccharothrix sp. NRRL B-16348 TaxID=1415542 RepID=UPI000B1A8CD6|nr:IS110 family transposase [Saccharothrix sp. NRRL B-16348]
MTRPPSASTRAEDHHDVAPTRSAGRRTAPDGQAGLRDQPDGGGPLPLANILRTDAHAHRPMPADSELAQAVAVLARATQDAIWRRTKAAQELRSLLREYYPSFLAAFAKGTVTNLASPEARAVLALAPTPTAASRLTRTRIATALRRAGRKRGIDALAAQLHQALRIDQLRQPPLVEDALGRQATALLATLDAECVNADQLGEATAEAFRRHPDHQIITSFPGLGDLTGDPSSSPVQPDDACRGRSGNSAKLLVNNFSTEARPSPRALRTSATLATTTGPPDRRARPRVDTPPASSRRTEQRVRTRRSLTCRSDHVANF